MPSIHILRPGTFTDSAGSEVTFTAADLASIATAYDPAKHEAPLVIGHPTADAPAYGWVASLREDDAGVHAEPHQLDTQFAGLVRAGRFRKVSASLYGASHPNSPTPGSWYLRHVGFLGAQPPAVKGLRQASLDESNQGAVVTMESTLPAPESSQPQETNMSGTQTAGQTARKNTTEIEAALTERETQLAEREAALAEREAQTRRQELDAAIEQHIAAGRVLPTDKPGLVALTEQLTAHPVKISLFDPDGHETKQGGAAWLLSWLGRQPVQVDFNERTAAAAEDPAAQSRFAVPAGHEVEPKALDLHRRALAFAEKHQVGYDAALTTIAQEAS